MRPAISLTFDDGLPCQIEHALPILDSRGLKATFFLIVNSPYDTEFRTEAWREAARHGHEIGSHSVNHRKAAELTPTEANSEVIQSQRLLESWLEVPVTSFCYPFTDAPAHLQDPVRKTYQQARGGRQARPNNLFVTKGDGFNPWNVPCFHVGPGTMNKNELPAIINTAIERKAWITLMFHGVGPDETQWDNISFEQFAGLCDTLVLAQKAGLWVAPFGTVAKEYR